MNREEFLQLYKSGERVFYYADLHGADLHGADLHGADLRGADLHGADLRGADLRGAYLRGAYLRGANLRGADLRGAYLRGANLRGVDLRGAYLLGAYLRGANLRGVDLHGAEFSIYCREIISSVLYEAATEMWQYSVAGLVMVMTEWCWSDFCLNLPRRELIWAAGVLEQWQCLSDMVALHLERVQNERQ